MSVTVWDAARDGKTSVLRTLQSEGVNLSAADELGNSPLHYAILNGCDITSEFLIANAPDVNVVNKEGLSPLLAAIIDGERIDTATYSRKADAIEFLIESGKANLDILDPQGRPALHRAIDFKSFGIMDAVLKAGATAANSQNASGETALMVAVSRGDQDTVGRLLKCGADCGIVAGNGQTALTFAIKNKHLNVVKAFAQQGADLNSANKFGETPLILAVKEDADDIVSTLVSRKVRINDGDQDGNTALHWAVMTQSLKYVKKLGSASLVNNNIPNARGITPLMLAVDLEKLDMVEAILASKVDVNVQDQEGSSAVHRAATKGNIEIITKLMENGGNEKLLNVAGKSPYDLAKTKPAREKFKEYNIDIWAAARKNDIGTVKKLLAQKVDVNAVDDEKSTPLHVACERGHGKVVDVLLEGGAVLDIVNSEGNLPLHCALLGSDSSLENKIDCVTKLIKRGSDVSAPDGKGYLPIHRAVGLKSASLVQQLLTKVGSSAVESCNSDGLTPLQVAATDGDAEVCAALLKAGCKTEVTTGNGDTPLLVACLSNNFGVAKKLLDAGAKATISNNDGVTPLLAAMNHDNMELFQALMSAKADVNQPDKDGNMCLHIAAKKGNLKLMQTLVDGGADINVRTAMKVTPLMLAAESAQLKALDLLLVSGKADVNAQDSDGNTALHRVCAKGELELIKRLLKENADVNLCNNEGNTPIEMNDHPQILYLFDEHRLINQAPTTSDEMIPCEFCNKMFALQAIMAHQFNCTGGAS